jgi:hypothetical protein
VIICSCIRLASWLSPVRARSLISLVGATGRCGALRSVPASLYRRKAFRMRCSRCLLQRRGRDACSVSCCSWLQRYQLGRHWSPVLRDDSRVAPSHADFLLWIMSWTLVTYTCSVRMLNAGILAVLRCTMGKCNRSITD